MKVEDGLLEKATIIIVAKEDSCGADLMRFLLSLEHEDYSNRPIIVHRDWHDSQGGQKASIEVQIKDESGKHIIDSIFCDCFIGDQEELGRSESLPEKVLTIRDDMYVGGTYKNRGSEIHINSSRFSSHTDHRKKRIGRQFVAAAMERCGI